MTITEAIWQVDTLKPNNYQDAEKIKWLDEIDRQIHMEIILTHEHTEEQETFEGYDDDTDGDTELIAPDPYSVLYRYWLEAMIDMYNLETDKYQNSGAMFNAAFKAYKDYYNRGHMPIERNRFCRT